MVENAIMKSRHDSIRQPESFASCPICFPLTVWDGHPMGAKRSAPSRPDKHMSQGVALP